jgi:transcription antitermination factor NusB
VASRRKAREAILRSLYISESRGIPVVTAFKEMEAVDREMVDQADDPDALPLKPFGLGLDSKQREWALTIAREVETSKTNFNKCIATVLKNWDISRVSRIDRLIMWIACAEMTIMLDIPPVVSINEAIELAKKFSSSKSPAFINGILDAIATNMDLMKRNQQNRKRKKSFKKTVT